MRLIDAEKFEVFNATCPITKGIRSGKTAAYFYGEGCRKVLEAIDAAPTIDPESLRPTAEWISVKDRLPKSRFVVLAYEKPLNTINMSFYEKNSESWIDCDSGYYLNSVTHWMPLPKPPEEPHD